MFLPYKQVFQNTRCLLWVILIFIVVPSFAQEAILPAGGDGSGSGGSVAHSIGQILYSSSSGASTGLIYGVQQPYEISVATGLEKYEDIDLVLSTYPNPVNDILVLKAESQIWRDLQFQLYYSDGRIFKSQKVLDAETDIDMSQFTPGVYLLRVSLENTPVKTFRIIKK